MKINYPVLYKQNAAIITEKELEKYTIRFQTQEATQTKKAQYSEQKVREKDIIPLFDGPVSSLENLLSFTLTDDEKKSILEETWLLLAEENLPPSEENASGSASSNPASQASSLPFSEIAEIMRPEAKAEESFFLYKTLAASLQFYLDEKALKQNEIKFFLRSEGEIQDLQKKLYEKEHEAEIHAAFIERLKKRELLPEDQKFMVEVENLALCKTEKSKVMQEAGITESPEKAHKLLLETGIWAITKNPYPTRYGLSMNSASEGLGLPPEEERLEVSGISYAIDSPWSNDPDDAVAFDGKYLWVHIADPACSVMPDSSIDKVARNKGTTLYLPEGAVRMLSETCFEDYALGLKEKSRALSFRLLLNQDGGIEECEVFKTFVNVKRLTYEKASEMQDSPELKSLFEIARRNTERRKRAGSVNIEMPEVHISVDSETKKVSITPVVHYPADSMVCEMMLLAGEGAARFAMNHSIPFPFVTQEAPDLPKEVMGGLAGQFKLLRGMRKRSVGITPGVHSGLGIAGYSQVTSPLRRYSDLVAHQQLRAYLDGRKLIGKDDMLLRISQGDAASVASRKASRLSETHWKLIYLLQNPEWQGKAVCIDHKDGNALMMIEELAMQITLKGREDIPLNQEVIVKPSKIDIVSQESDFQIV